MATPRSKIARDIDGEPVEAVGSVTPVEFGDFDEPDDVASDLALMTALAEIGETTSDANVIVYRIEEKTNRDTYLYRVGLSEFAASGLEEIQQSYGAGEYRVRVFHPKGIGRKGVITQKRIKIGAPPAKAREAVPTGNAGIEALIAQQGAMMMQGIQRIGEIIAASQRPAPQGMGVQETIQLVGALGGLMGGRAPATDPIELVGRIVALQRDLAPPPTNGNGEIDAGAVILKAMDTFGPTLAQAVQQRAAVAPAQAMRPAPAPVVTNPAPALPAPAHQPQEPETMSDLQAKVALFKGPLLVMAGANADPYTYASMLLDLFDDDDIAKYVEADGWRENLYALIPEAREHPAWFEAVRNQALEMLQEPPEAANVLPNANPAT